MNLRQIFCMGKKIFTSRQKSKQILLTSMWVFALCLPTYDRSAHLPIDTSRFFRYTCLQSQLHTSPPTDSKSYPNFQNPRATFENTPPSPKIAQHMGEVECPHFYLVESHYKLLMQSAAEPIHTFLGEKLKIAVLTSKLHKYNKLLITPDYRTPVHIYFFEQMQQYIYEFIPRWH